MTDLAAALIRAEELLRRAAKVVETSPETPIFAAELTAAAAEIAAVLTLPPANTEADVERVTRALLRIADYGELPLGNANRLALCEAANMLSTKSLTRPAGGEEVALREVLAGLVEGVKRHCNEPGGGGISGFLSARLTDAENALTKPPALPKGSGS